MRNKQILTGRDALEGMARGLNKAANVVCSTLGPNGRLTSIQKKTGPFSTKDGYHSLLDINFEDAVEDMGVQTLKQVTLRTNEIAGDGTTTATCLSREMVNEGVKLVSAGLNPRHIKQGIDMATEAVINDLQKSSKQITSKKELVQVGTISANGDQSIGEDIARAMGKIGDDGVITVEFSKSMKTEVEIVEGMQVHSGYISPYFVTNQSKMQADLDEAYVLVYDGKIINIRTILGLLEQVINSGKALLVIAEDVSDEALNTLVRNNMLGSMAVAAIQAPNFGDKELLKDIATVTGANIISRDVGTKLENATISDLGYCGRIEVTRDRTMLINGAGNKTEIKNRVGQIKSQIEESQDPQEIDDLQRRMAKITGGVAVMKIGGSSELEVREKKDRVDDALNATRAAVEEGIVPGGGLALLKAKGALKSLQTSGNGNADIQAGINLVAKALEAPIRQIASNGGVEGSEVISQLKAKAGNVGYDAKNDTYVDMFKAGIIDPLKVVRVALTDAASVASIFITTHSVITNQPVKDGLVQLPDDFMNGMEG